MARVIENRVVVCDNCLRHIEYTQEDIGKKRNWHQNRINHYIKCPNCDYPIWVGCSKTDE